MIHKIPLYAAVLLGYAGYVALGSSTCDMANRAVMPIHWVGAGLNYANNNFRASNNEISEKSIGSGFDSAAAYVRDAVLVLGQGKAYCHTFQQSLKDPILNKPKTDVLSTPEISQEETPPPISPVNHGPVFKNPAQ